MAALRNAIERLLARGGRLKILIPILAILLLLSPLLGRRAATRQPIEFNHLKHTQELELECEFCHSHVQTGAHAGLPGAETCSLCHSMVQGDSEEAARVTELLEAGDPLRFNKLFRMPDHVFYTHRRHVAIGGIECHLCHGPIAETERPPSRPLVNVSMDFCMDCHTEQEQTLDCNACHR